MTENVEVLVINPAYWSSRVPQLAQLLATGAVGPIGDPTGTPPNPETMLTVVDSAYWSREPGLLADALIDAVGGSTSLGTGGGTLAAGAAPATQERLTLSVEEASAALGISRALGYEAVRRGDIPHIRIGKRVLIPRAALDRLLASAESSTDPEDQLGQ